MSWIEVAFPGLIDSEWEATSPETVNYNCIGWALGINTSWVWPPRTVSYAIWPAEIPFEETIEAFRLLFEGAGFRDADNADLEFEFEKIAIFSNDSGVPTHAARQLISGKWTSKLGLSEDIEHELHALEGTIYGRVAVVMKREIPVTSTS